MKSKTVRRGLYRRVTHTTHSGDLEQWVPIPGVAASIDDYVDGHKEHAANILRENGIDPDSLFDIVAVDKKLTTRERNAYQDHGKEPPQSRAWECMKWTTFDRDSLSTEVDQALEVILQCQNVQRDLDSPESRDTLCNGIRLATAIEHLNANIAWRKSVAAGEGTRKGGVKGAEVRHGEIGAKAKARVAAYQLRRTDHPHETKKKSKIAVAQQCSPPVGYKQVETDLRAVARSKKEG